jgi:RecB family exonuclease
MTEEWFREGRNVKDRFIGEQKSFDRRQVSLRGIIDRSATKKQEE